MAFEQVKMNNLPVWNGMSVKNASGDSIPLAKTEKSYVIGYYLGADHIQGKQKEIRIHKLQFEECGDATHLSEPVEKGANIMVWGAAALDDKLIKNVPVGVLVRIEWLGKVPSKANSGQKYHDFDVQIDKDKVLSQSAPAPQQSSAPANAAQGAPAETAPATMGATASPANMMDKGDDDDLPF